MYTIGQVSEMFGLPISTLRYYDKQGLFPGMERISGIRKFSEKEIETLRVIECLKRSGRKSRILNSLWTGVWREQLLILNEKNCLRSKRKQWKLKLNI